MHFYSKENRIKMWSEEPIEAPNFEHTEILITDLEKNNLVNNWEGQIVNGKLILNPSHQILSSMHDDIIKKAKDDIKKAKNLEEIKSILDKLLS